MELNSLFSDDFESVSVSSSLKTSRQQLLVLHSAVWDCAVLFPWSSSGCSVSLPRMFCGWAAALGSGKCLLASLAQGGESTQQKVQSRWRCWDTRPNFGVGHRKLCRGSRSQFVSIVKCPLVSHWPWETPVGLGHVTACSHHTCWNEHSIPAPTVECCWAGAVDDWP